jgi:hypothetical protein
MLLLGAIEFQPLSQFAVAQSTVGEGDDLQCGFFFAGFETITINSKESVGLHKSSKLVAVDEGVVFTISVE